MLLGMMAAAVVAFAAPASASATVWWHEGVPIEEDVTIGLHGTLAAFNEGGSGWRCDQVEGEARLEPGNGGQITALDLSSCRVQGALALIGCSIKHIAAENLPWPILANEINGPGSGYVEIPSGLKITTQLDFPATSTCELIREIVVENYPEGGPSLGMTADDSAAIEKFEIIHGNVVISFGGTGFLQGHLDVTPPWEYGFGAE